MLFVNFGDYSLVSCIFCKYFVPFYALPFVLFMISFAVQKILSLVRAHLFIFVFISITLGDGSKKILLRFMSRGVFSVYSY